MSEERPKILYVDDIPMNLKLFEATFRQDYDIILSESPQEALEILGKEEIQVLVSDQRMPEMTGIELLETVAEKHPDIRRFLLTAFTDTETVIEAVNVGRIHGYIKKPLQPDEIRQSINSSIEVYQLRQKNRQVMQELERANTELKNMDELKTEIIHSISNEISSPLNRIMGTLHLLKTKIQGDELTEVVNLLDHSVFKLEQFSTLARQVSRIKSPSFRLKKNKVSLRQVIQFGAIETTEELREQDISLIREKDHADQEVDGDAGLLVSCLVSLIQFAKEHTEKNGEIKVESVSVNGTHTCIVEDGGANYDETLFGLLTSHFSGPGSGLNLNMGIGLALAQMIMETHGGRLAFKKTPEDHGQLRMEFPAGP